MSLLEQLKNLFVPRTRMEREQQIRKRMEACYQSLEECRGTYTSPDRAEKLTEEWRGLDRRLKGLHVSKNSSLGQSVRRFRRDCRELPAILSAWNDAFFQGEKDRCRDFLSHIDGKSLDEQQRTAVVCDAPRTLVVAGAGSGKTLTIAAKVSYLCSMKGAAPEDILLLAFTRKAAEEMTRRIQGRLGLNVRATTFHKLGLDILTRASGSRPEVVDQLQPFVRDYLERQVLDKPAALRDLLCYFAYYLNVPANLEDDQSLGEAYEAERGAELESLRSKVRRGMDLETLAEQRGANRRSLRREQMKSLEEVSIANFLFLNGVEYEYERRYPFAASGPTRKAYRPDFYLPEYDLYLEHFGINAQGRAPWLDKDEERSYLEGIEWKRAVHRENGTTLLETYSYYTPQGRLLEELEQLLVRNGVRFREPDYRDIFCKAYESAGEKYLSGFVRLCCTFLTLFKSGGHSPEELIQFRKDRTGHPFHRRRRELFLRILAPILRSYNDMLRQQNAVDFSDMINWTTALVEGGFRVHPWRWVIVDEYQDCSVARYKLLQSILNQTGAKLFCVGDDWQSIYRFAGSDLSLFTRFEDYFGPSERLYLEQTYRNAQQLIDEAGRFVMRSPEQLQKHLRSDKRLEYPIVFLFYRDNPAARLKQALDKCIQEQGRDASILLLGRTNYDLELLRAAGLFRVRRPDAITYVDAPETPVSFLTVHRSKGLEADNVILLNFRNDTLGFPNQITDDPLLELVLQRPERFPYGEERRLLYVALTRTRNRVYLLVDESSPSVFLKEFPSSPSVHHQHDQAQRKQILCPRCKKGFLLLRRGKQRSFVGCSNYPSCNYTLGDTRVLSDPRPCPQCGGFLVERRGEWGRFLGCSNYPSCTHTEPLEAPKQSGKNREKGEQK